MKREPKPRRYWLQTEGFDGYVVAAPISGRGPLDLLHQLR